MATIIDECIDNGFFVMRMASWYASCDGCNGLLDIDDNDTGILTEAGWITNDDGQFCSLECYTLYVGVTINE